MLQTENKNCQKKMKIVDAIPRTWINRYVRISLAYSGWFVTVESAE
jgi:hypothetical protein